MSAQKKSYKHTKPIENFNDDFLDYIIHSVYDADEIENDEPSLGYLDDFREVIQGAKTRNEARNRLIRAAREKGTEFFTKAINDYNFDYGNKDAGIEYVPNSFDIGKLKMRPILAKEMDIGDVNAYVDKLAKLMGYMDNGTEGGAIASLLKDYYGDSFLSNLAGGHAGDYSFYKENRALADALKEKFDSIEGSEILRRELGYNPFISDEDLFNVDRGIPSFAQRAFRARARGGDLPNKIVSFTEGLVAPQTAGALDEGRTPQAVDIGTDAFETALLGPAKTGKAILKTPLKAMGFETALDVLHDAIKGATDDKVYSEGNMPISGKDDFSAGSVLNIKERVPALMQAGLYGKVAGGVPKKVVSNINKYFDKKIDPSKDGVISEMFERLADKNKELRFAKENLSSVNANRKRNGLNALTEREYMDILNKDIEEIALDIRNTRRKNALEALFEGAARTGAARALYNPQSTESSRKTVIDILSKFSKGE